MRSPKDYAAAASTAAQALVAHGSDLVTEHSEHVLGFVRGALPVGAMMTLRNAARSLQAGEDRVAAARVASEWDRRHAEAVAAERSGRENAEADLRLIRQGADPARQVNLQLARTNLAYNLTIARGLDEIAAGR
jgi:hypothetical protein